MQQLRLIFFPEDAVEVCLDRFAICLIVIYFHYCRAKYVCDLVIKVSPGSLAEN